MSKASGEAEDSEDGERVEVISKMLPTYTKVPTTDKTINLNLDNVKRVLDALKSNPLLSGQFVADITLATGSNNVAHGLQRNYQSFLTSLPSAAGITLQEGTSSDRSQYLNIIASAPCAISLFVF